jgi:acyl-CoA thioesterase
VKATLVQDGQPLLDALVTLGTLREDAHVRYEDAKAPDLTPPEECRRSMVANDGDTMPVVDLRVDHRDAPWSWGEVTDRGEFVGWMRLDDGSGEWDPASLLFATDMLPPATFALGSSGWVPTLQLTSYVHQIPQGEWLSGRQWCTIVADGLATEQCELFDGRGRLVASASQLMMARFPHGI